MSNKQISFNFPNIKRIQRQEVFNKEVIKKTRKVRNDSGTRICIGCGVKKHDCSEVFLFQRSDSNGNEHHLGYVYSKENMKKDPLFTKFVDKVHICEECQEYQ